MIARAVLSLLLWACWARADPAVLRCVSCQQLIQGKYLRFSEPSSPDPQPVCAACGQLETVCYLCRVPVKTPALKLPDGRWLCARDARTAVVAQSEAERIFEEAKRELMRLFRGMGEAPDRTIDVSLVDQPFLEEKYTKQRSAHDKSFLQGLTRTQSGPGKALHHSIYLLSGMPRARLMAVSAHEYTHAWMHENIPADRKFEADTVEGFCELVAYKLMMERGEEAEKRVILANAYTRGQIDAFVKAEDSLQFHRVVTWIKTGLDEKIEQSDTGRLLAIREKVVPELLWLRQATSPVPDTLTLKAITGNARRRFALINNCTLEVDEEARVRVGTSNVTVRCLEISDRSVTVQVRGQLERATLSMR